MLRRCVFHWTGSGTTCFCNQTMFLDLLSKSFPGSHSHHLLQFFYLGALLLGCDAADYIKDCLAHAGNHGNVCCRVSLSRWQYFRWTGKANSVALCPVTKNCCVTYHKLREHFVQHQLGVLLLRQLIFFFYFSRLKHL